MTDNIKYRTFTVDTKGRIKKADGYKITTCTIKYEDGLFETGLTVCKCKHYIRKEGQEIAEMRLNAGEINALTKASFVLESREDRVYNILRLIIKRYVNTMQSLKHIEVTDLR